MKLLGLRGVEALGNGLTSACFFLTHATEAFPVTAEKGAVVVDVHGTCMKDNKPVTTVNIVITGMQEHIAGKQQL